MIRFVPRVIKVFVVMHGNLHGKSPCEHGNMHFVSSHWDRPRKL